MADTVLFSLTAKILLKITTPAFKAAYERVLSIWDAKEELGRLEKTITTIQASLGDAEKKVAGPDSEGVKNWIEKTKDVLYDADDLFDEVLTNDLLKQQKGNSMFTKVQISLSKRNPILSNDSIVKKVNGVRKSLQEISEDMAHNFNFAVCDYEKSMPSMRRGEETGGYVEPKDVFGRDNDKEAIIELLLDESNAEKSVSVIVIAGIGGMGKSTLAQLVYCDENIQKSFRKKWWAWISKTSDYTQVVGKVYQSITNTSYHNRTMSKLEFDIRESISINHESTGINEKFLLVLDDLWEEERATGMRLMSLFSSNNAKGSKILVTTRSPSVAKAIGADVTYNIKELSSEASWDLFKSLAFTGEQDNDSSFIDLGKKIVEKCANVPLAIKSIASLLNAKNTIEEWKRIEERELSLIDLKNDSIISALKLSYDHLLPHLKQCFAYCYLFPKGHTFCKEELIYLWIAQGYVKQDGYETIEAAGEVCFIELLRRSFIQEVEQDKHVACKKHSLQSLMHDLAQRVAGQECIVLTENPRELHNKFRHLSVGYGIDNAWNIPDELLSCSGLRSSLFKYDGSLSSLPLDNLSDKFKVLRALNLGNQKIKKISTSFGELKHLRYLNLSGNTFKDLPDSLTTLVNLYTLDISSCKQLKALPIGFSNLINLRHLDNKECVSLSHMPPRFGELPSLRRLSCFKVSSGGKCSRLDAFAKLKLTGELMIEFDKAVQDWNGDECWPLPSAIQVLAIVNYPVTRMPHWDLAMSGTTSSGCSLVKLQVTESSVIKFLPSFKFLSNLKDLELSGLDQLEYVEEVDQGVGSQSGVAISLPCLEKLTLSHLPNLMYWSLLPQHQMPSFPRLSNLKIEQCEKLMYMPLSTCVQTLELKVINEDLMQLLLGSSPNPSSLKTLIIWECHWLKKFSAEALTTLQFLELGYCNKLQHLFLDLSPLNALEELVIRGCPQLVLWGERSNVVWHSLPNLRVLSLDEIPDEERLPICLRNLQSNGRLKIKQQQ